MAEAAGTVHVRPMTAADVTEVTAMAKEFQDYLNALSNPGDAAEPAALNADALRRFGFGETLWFNGLVAERNGRPVGYMLYHFGFSAESAAGSLFVDDLFVRREARRQGAGQALMNEAVRLLRKRGGEIIMWTVWDRNPAAIAFYQSLGATTISEELFLIWPSKSWPAV